MNPHDFLKWIYIAYNNKHVSAMAFCLVLTINTLNAQNTVIAGKYQLYLSNDKYYNLTGTDTIAITTDNILIKLKDCLTYNERLNFEARYPITKNKTTKHGVTLYYINSEVNFINLINNISSDPDVELYDINHICKLASSEKPNDAAQTINNLLSNHENLLWPYTRTNLFAAWELTAGNSDIIVADIDDGIWIDHPDIASGSDGYSNLWINLDEYYGVDNQSDDENLLVDDKYGWNFADDNNNMLSICYPMKSHGTMVSSIISSKTNNDLGIWGVAGGYSSPGVKIMMVRCSKESNPTFIETSYYPFAIAYAAEMGARIIIIPYESNVNIANLEEEINRIWEEKKVVFLAPTGNGAEQNYTAYPAKYDNVIAVGATECDWNNSDASEGKWFYVNTVGSNWGDVLELTAPGGPFTASVDFTNNSFIDTYDYETSEANCSTSQAVSFAAGVAALVLSAEPCLTNDEVRTRLKQTAFHIPGYTFENDWNQYIGYGRVDALKALQPVIIDPITGTEIWDSDRKIYNDLFIEAQGNLTISNCTIFISPWAKIIVKPWGKLTLNNCTITSMCDQRTWQGIQVWGVPGASQYTLPGQISAQGTLIINGATIENALTAVDLWKPGEPTMTGGIIFAQDAIFKNNSRAIHALNYRNFNPFNPSQELDYYGTFTNCSFILDEDYLGAKTFYKHVDLDHVKGIKFHGCTFNLDHSAENVSEWSLGIAAYNAGFSVLPVCMTSTIPCEEYDSCRFSGFQWAIGTYNNSINPVQIVNAHFDDNVVGIFVSSTNYPVILENFFEVGFDEGNHGSCGFANGLGIDIHSSIGFAVENNIFRKNLQAPLGIYAGIRAFWCRTDYDLIYKNDFRGLTYGNYAEGTNRKDPLESNDGIEYQCNQNFINIEDFRVTAEYSQYAMVRGTHGNRVTASGNRFSRATSPNNWHFWYGGTQIINWHYCESPCIDEKPEKIYELEEEYFVEIESPGSNDCPDHYGGGGHINLSASEKTEKELEFLLNQSDYNAVNNLYESLKDGGNTQSELSDIQIAEPDEMWHLRTQLLGHSPHLSQDVLRAVSDRTDVFPDDVLLEILAANPDELNRDTLLSYLEQKENPLPDYMIGILRQAVGGVTYKTILLDEMAKYHAKQHQAVRDIIRSILFDTLFNVNDYRNWLDNLGGIESDKQIISSYLQEMDTTNAKTLLYLLPTLYELEGDELEDYGNYQMLIEMQIDMMANGKTIFDLDSLEIGLLEEIAIDGQTGSGNLARNILTYAFNYQFCDCLDFTDSTQLKRNGANSSNAFNLANYALKISTSPNPAHTWVAINYELPLNETKGEIRINDITGKVILHFKVNSNIGQNVWDTRGVPPGLYYVRLTSSGLNRSVKLVIL